MNPKNLQIGKLYRCWHKARFWRHEKKRASSSPVVRVHPQDVLLYLGEYEDDITWYLFLKGDTIMELGQVDLCEITDQKWIGSKT